MKYTVKYYPPELSSESIEKIKNNISPSMTDNEDGNWLYNCDYILETFPDIQEIKDACEGCDYLEL